MIGLSFAFIHNGMPWAYPWITSSYLMNRGLQARLLGKSLACREV